MSAKGVHGLGATTEVVPGRVASIPPSLKGYLRLDLPIEKAKEMWHNFKYMETMEEKVETPMRPRCFGDEGTFMDYLENSEGNSPCRTCPSENECGEFILFKCSRELCF